jgi:hypothetical protein
MRSDRTCTCRRLNPHVAAAREAVYAAHGVVPPSANPKLSHSILAWLFYAAFPTVLLALLGRRSAARDFIPATPAS